MGKKDKMTTKFEKLPSQIKSGLTRFYNSTHKTTVKKSKKKRLTEKQNEVILDEEGNVLEEILDDNDDAESKNGESEISFSSANLPKKAKKSKK
jgi:hypothetical protein